MNDAFWKHRRAGFSLLEVLAAVSIVGVISFLVISRFFAASDAASLNTCYLTRGQVEVQAQLWHRQKGAWPATNLSDIGVDADYFPGGMPVCPVDGSGYALDANTHEVVGHTH